jgi:hypothetical protein
MAGLGLTDPQMRALVAVREQARQGRGRATDPVSPRQVALALWPQSEAWDHRPRRHDGRSGALGGTMPMKAAQLLWRLRERGLVEINQHNDLWTLTERGVALLRRGGHAQPLPNLPKPPTPVRRRKDQEKTP